MTVVSPRSTAGAAAAAGRVAAAAATAPRDLDGRFLVVAATSIDVAQPRACSPTPRRAALLCNVVDVPELCSFILPAVHREGPIARRRLDRRRLAGARAAPPRRRRGARRPASTPSSRDELRALRPWAKRALCRRYEARRDYFRRARRGGAAVTVRVLVGAGPGDPGLITARGLELVRCCDARRLRPARRAGARRRGARGRAARRARADSRRTRSTSCSSRLGRRGLEVVRLKGGDPFLFGRGGEEALALAEAGVPFEVVPGVSSLAAVPAAAGIPVTHRGMSAQVTIVNGHPGRRELDYAALACRSRDARRLHGPAPARRARDRPDRARQGSGHAGRRDLERHAAGAAGRRAPLADLARAATSSRRLSSSSATWSRSRSS